MRAPTAVVADSNRLVGECLSWVAQQRVSVIGHVSSGADLLVAVRRCRPSIVITDASLPDCSGLDIIRSLKHESFTPDIILVSGSDWFGGPKAAISEGVAAFVSKQFGAEVLLRAIGEVVAGRSYVAQAELAARGAGLDALWLRLTARQRQVLPWLLNGHRAKQIAKELNLSTRTVEAHKYSLMQTFNVHSTLELRKVLAPYLQAR